MKQMKGLMGGKGDELELMAQSMDPDALAHDMLASDSLDKMQGDLGPNPFAGGGLPGLGGAGGLPGLGAGIPSHGGKKKNRKKKGK